MVAEQVVEQVNGIVFVSKEEAAAFADVAAIHQKLDSAVIEHSYLLGECIDTVLQNAAAKGRNTTTRLSRSLQKVSIAIRLCYTTPDACTRRGRIKSKFDELANLQHKDGWRLKWTHFVYLSHTGLHRQRQLLGKRAFRERWTTQQLFDALKAEKNQDEKRGRPAKLIPKTIDDCLKHIAAQVTTMIETADTKWFGDKFNLLSAITEKPIDEITDELLGELQQVVSDMRGLSSAFITHAEDLCRLATALAAKKDAPAPVVTYENEPAEEPPAVKRTRRRGRVKQGQFGVHV